MFIKINVNNPPIKKRRALKWKQFIRLSTKDEIFVVFSEAQ